MICCTDSKHGGNKNSIPWVIFVYLLNVKRADDIYDSLINAFYDSIGMLVPSCDRTAFKSVFFTTYLGEF